MPSLEGYESLLAKLGKCKTAKSCLYIKGLDDVEMPVLKKLISKSVTMMASKRV